MTAPCLHPQIEVVKYNAATSIAKGRCTACRRVFYSYRSDRPSIGDIVPGGHNS